MKALLAAAALVLALASGCASTSSSSSPKTPSASDVSSMNRRSRTFVRDMRLCVKEVRVMEQIFQGGTLQQDADALTTVRGDCGKLRDTMLGMDTSHFSSQALDAYVAMDKYKSALGKVGDYIDTSAPTKLSEAKQGLADAAQLAQQAVAEINGRRAVYGLPAL